MIHNNSGDVMWIIYAIYAAFFSGLTTIFIKKGIKNVNSILSVGIRTIIIVIISLISVILNKSFTSIQLKTLLYLIISGICTSLLWISYFKALDLGDVSQVTPVDKTSIVLTLILSNIFLNEKITVIKLLSIILILVGTFMMINKKEKTSNNKWLIYAIMTSIFTSISSIISKIGLISINPYLGNLIRTIVVLLIIWIIVFYKKLIHEIKYISKKSWIYLILSGISTSLSWITYFKALKSGDASIVFPIEKLSIVVSVTLSYLILKEKISIKSLFGLILIIIATTILILNI